MLKGWVTTGPRQSSVFSFFLSVWRIAFILSNGKTYIFVFSKTRAGVYETLCPNICLPLKDNLETRCQNQKRGIIQSNIYRNFPKVNQVIYTVDKSVCQIS